VVFQNDRAHLPSLVWLGSAPVPLQVDSLFYTVFAENVMAYAEHGARQGLNAKKVNSTAAFNPTFGAHDW